MPCGTTTANYLIINLKKWLLLFCYLSSLSLSILILLPLHLFTSIYFLLLFSCPFTPIFVFLSSLPVFLFCECMYSFYLFFLLFLSMFCSTPFHLFLHCLSTILSSTFNFSFLFVACFSYPTSSSPLHLTLKSFASLHVLSCPTLSCPALSALFYWITHIHTDTHRHTHIHTDIHTDTHADRERENKIAYKYIIW